MAIWHSGPLRLGKRMNTGASGILVFADAFTIPPQNSPGRAIRMGCFLPDPVALCMTARK
jgi:hypothetical protein